MPRGDGTGPWGAGPMTGWGAGYCAGYGAPGSARPAGGRGRGFRRSAWARTGWPPDGWVNGPAWGYPQTPLGAEDAPVGDRDNEIETLKAKAAQLERAVKEVTERLARLTQGQE